MLFTTDKQTQEDLNIFGKRGTDSILSLFNHTFTLKGAQLLEEMFRYPLSDADAINARTNKISYLKTVKATFPFSTELFDQAEQYLSTTDERTKLPAKKPSMDKMLTNLIAADADYKQIVNGISALITIVQRLSHLLNDTLLSAGSPLKKDEETIKISRLIHTEPIDRLLRENPKNKLPYENLVAWDEALRFYHSETVGQILGYIYRLDVYLSVAKVAVERELCFPTALPAPQHKISINDFHHPQLRNAVTNSISISRESNVVFLTGANMAGKSTIMKSLGITMYLAHMGFPVAAREMEFSVLDGIYTTINLPDNLGLGASHFYAEVIRVKKVATALSTGRNILVIFDELFRGTNVKDAYEATIAITAAFAKKRKSIFIISTHIIEAGEILRQYHNISFKYLPTRMQDNTPEYTYTLETGITNDRHGMLIIKNEGILELLKKRKEAESE